MFNQIRSRRFDALATSRDLAISPGDAGGPVRRMRHRDITPEANRSCPVCRGNDISDHRNNLSCWLVCRHVFQSDLQVTAVYDAEYARRYDSLPHRAMSALRWNFIQRWLRLASGSRILDIG